jgi:outer-membrane receptor for ferric coprogen and ferric-rhodotorulic acid
VSPTARRVAPLVLRPLAVAAAQCLVAAQAQTAEPVSPPTQTVTVTAQRERGDEGYSTRTTGTATKLELSPRDTPQSISVVPRALIDDFVLNDVNNLLSSVTGVSVERVEPDRSYFSVRGFEVSTFQIDGVGLPFATGDQIGNLDTALYERVEVLRGANGLMSSTGNPSATVNFVRRRPTAHLRGSVALTLGSWNTHRVDADLSGSLNASGSVRGRVTAAAQEGDSYLDRYSLTKYLFSGIVEADVTPDTRLSFGHSQQHNRPKGVMWGALPMVSLDANGVGTPTNYPTSANAAPGWTFWNTGDTQTFAEATQRLAQGWRALATLTQRTLRSSGELFFVIGVPEAGTGEGLSSWPSKYQSRETQWIADAYVTGPVTLAGRRHELVVGANAGRSRSHLASSDDDGLVDLTEAEMLAGTFPRPAFDNGVTGSAEFTDQRRSLYALARWNLADTLKLMTGVNATRVTSRGQSYSIAHEYEATRATPYVGATWAFDGAHALYASYGRIFNPQTQIDVKGDVLAPIQGSNAELGVKGEWLGGRLNGSFAVFRVEQDNTAEQAGFDTLIGTYYRGVDATSTGFEAELAGTVAPGWELSAGYTQLRIVGPSGEDVRTYVPRRTLRVTTSVRPNALKALKLGASVRWQSRYERTDGGVVTPQGAYALLDLAATYDITRHVSLTAKVENVTDRRHLNSLLWSQSYYGAPRNGSVVVSWTY